MLNFIALLFLGAGGWRWPLATSHQIIVVLNTIPNDLFPYGNSWDKAVWMLGNSGTFSISSAWNEWRVKKASVVWNKLFPGHIPRFSTLAWPLKNSVGH